MTTITETLTADHKACDELLAAAEESLFATDWETGTPLYQQFRERLERHLAAEENVLFPEFEQTTGQRGGPTQMMRLEHSQMRQLLIEMDQAVSEQDDANWLGLSETLMMLIQQHNMKEQQMLYPMTDQVLADKAEALLQQMDL